MFAVNIDLTYATPFERGSTQPNWDRLYVTRNPIRRALMASASAPVFSPATVKKLDNNMSRINFSLTHDGLTYCTFDHIASFLNLNANRLSCRVDGHVQCYRRSRSRLEVRVSNRISLTSSISAHRFNCTQAFGGGLVNVKLNNGLRFALVPCTKQP